MTQDIQRITDDIVKKYSRCPFPAPKVTRRGKPHTTVDFSGISEEIVTARDNFYMSLAIELAREAMKFGEVPVGALIVRGEEIISAGFNLRETEKNALSHAECSVIRDACSTLGGWRLPGCELFVTLEPCIMCAGAIVSSRVPRVVFGAPDQKAGFFGGVCDATVLPLNHKPTVVSAVLEEECRALLTEFFTSKRK